jgi:predicted enzyme related to lactoylglutathione lyase
MRYDILSYHRTRIAGIPMDDARFARTRFERADPILNVSDMAHSLRYYVDALGFTNAKWGGDQFTCVSRDDAHIYLARDGQGLPGTWVWLGVEDVDDLYREYQTTGATILDPPRNFPWAREMRVGDPDGHVLRFGSDPEADVEAGT